ncbi:MAG: hypothetical protein JRJ19_11125 [Deltaproteobacteria bacterium]|nr:hypothetical protein [Deltaproteobacteria bacterium]
MIFSRRLVAGLFIGALWVMACSGGSTSSVDSGFDADGKSDADAESNDGDGQSPDGDSPTAKPSMETVNPRTETQQMQTRARLSL